MACVLGDASREAERGLSPQTVQSVSYLSYLFHERQQYGPFLVIVPLSTITAWQSQFQTWAPELHVVTYIGSAAARAVARQYEFYGQMSKKLKMNVLLTTYEITLRDVKELGEIKWQMLMVDEVRVRSDGSWRADVEGGERPGTSSEELGESAVRGSEGVLGRVQGSHHGYSASEQREGSVDAHLFMSRGSAHVSPGQNFLR